MFHKNIQKKICNSLEILFYDLTNANLPLSKRIEKRNPSLAKKAKRQRLQKSVDSMINGNPTEQDTKIIEHLNNEALWDWYASIVTQPPEAILTHKEAMKTVDEVLNKTGKTRSDIGINIEKK